MAAEEEDDSADYAVRIAVVVVVERAEAGKAEERDDVGGYHVETVERGLGTPRRGVCAHIV